MRPFRPEKIPRPTLPEAVLQRLSVGVSDFEIGAGQGLHAIRYSLMHPNRKVLAVERTKEKFEKFLGRYERHSGLENLIPLHADAVSVVTHFIPDRSLERIFLLYPNPYPKKKQTNQRWHNSSFMAYLLAKLKVGGRLYLSTNLSWYALEAKVALTDQWQLKLASEAWVHDTRLAQTHFERKYLGRGEVCIRQIYVKD